MMKRVAIVTDSTADLTVAEREAMNVTVVPLGLTVEGETYVDGVDFTPEEFLVKLASCKELPKSSQPATGAFLEVFDRLHKEGYDEILCILISEHLSGTCQSARLAGDMTEAKVVVHSSHTVSCAIQFQIVEAYKMLEAGCSMDEIVAQLEKMRADLKLYIGVDSVDNLIKGGRLSKGKGMFAKVLNIKPIITFMDGRLEPAHKVRSMNQVAKYFIQKLEEDMDQGKSIQYMRVIHVGAKESAEAFSKELGEKYSFEMLPIVAGTSVLATHVGPGTMAIAYYCA